MCFAKIRETKALCGWGFLRWYKQDRFGNSDLRVWKLWSFHQEIILRWHCGKAKGIQLLVYKSLALKSPQPGPQGYSADNSATHNVFRSPWDILGAASLLWIGNPFSSVLTKDSSWWIQSQLGCRPWRKQ